MPRKLPPPPPTELCGYCKEKPSVRYIKKVEISVCETCNLLFDPIFQRVRPKIAPWIKE